MNQSNFKPSLLPGKRIAFVQAAWHKDIVEQSRVSFIENINEAGIYDSDVDLIEVPGSLEIPLQCKLLAKSGCYQIIIAAGFIVDGGIYRHDFVASTVLDGMMQVQLETEVPILSIVLTPHYFNEQEAHHDFFSNHFRVKGQEAAQACIQVLSIQMSQIELNKVA